MIFKFHGYKHPANEVDITSITQQRQYSPRNRVVFIRKTMTIQGHMCVSGQASIRDAIELMENAYEAEWHTVGLYHDDGTPSAHVLDFGTSLNGIRLLTLDYTKEDGGEYATGRSYRAVFQADYLPKCGVEDQVYSWDETVTVVGNGGPSWELVPQLYGDPIYQINATRTPQHVVQAGESVGVQGFIAPPAPYWPTQCHEDKILVEHGTAQKKGRNPPGGSLLYPTKWRYSFSLMPYNVPVAGVFPIPRL
jgi:hypothetical protein